jgi:DNA-binding CsgD family transcriptional regulator
MMADGDGGIPGAGLLAQQALWRQAGGQQQRGAAMLDRQQERAAIGRVLDAVRKGFSGTLVLRGGPGEGKTTLLEYAIDSAADLRISSAAGVESEISLEFAALHQVLVPFMPLLPALPAPQRDAMKIAFGLEAGPPPHLFLVGLAALTLLSRAAEDQPLLCVIDDGQWLDHESAHVLGFVARRLYADRVGFIAAVGEPSESQAFDRLPAITVGGLPDAEARELLASAVDGPLNALVADRILADTHNNPLALVEIGTMYTAEQLAGRASLPEPLPLGQRLRDSFLRQVRDLPPDAQAFVLLAATDVTGERGRLWRAAAQAGIDADTAATAAETGGILEFSGNSVRFRHPLLRSAVYHGAADRDRRLAHAALSETASSEGDLDQRTWHRAAAAIAPDEELASEVQHAAERACGRGGWTAAAALLRRSAELTPGDGARAKREVALAGAELRAGHGEQARELVRAAIPRLADDAARGLAKRLNGEILLFEEGNAAEAAAILADASRALAPDARLARNTMLEALYAAIWAGPAEIQQIVRAAQTLPAASSPPTVTDLLLEGYCARYTAGYHASVGPLRAAVAALRTDDPDPEVGVRRLALGIQAAGSLWDEQAVFDLSDRMARTARALGTLPILPVALAYLAISDCLTGRFGDADARWAEMRELLAESRPGMLGIDSRGYGLLLEYRGRITEARAAGVAQIHESTARGQRALADVGRYIVAVADLLGGDYDAAMSAALPVVDDDPAFTAELSLPELVEAAIRAGDREAAAIAYQTLSQRALAAGTPWALGLRARCQALQDDSGHAEDAYLESLSQLARSRVTVELARTHLLYGQWLRRAKRRRDARRELRTAQDMFAAMGADHFTEVAGTELRATGERARARRPETVFDLTPQEARVAGLAAGGASNNEIAAQLFLSPSTVDYHLRKVFRKLNVTSRTQLAQSLGPAPESHGSGSPRSGGH